jgi:diguanylate cyclase
MSTQLHTLDANPISDWKDKYYQTLNKFEEKEKSWSQEENGLYKSILRLIISYTGLDDELDQQLSSMRDSLRKESSNAARSKIINPIIEEVVRYAQQRDEEPIQTDRAADYLGHLLNKLELPDRYQKQLVTIRKSLAKEPEGNNVQISIDQLSALVNQASSTEVNGENEPETNRIELKADDPLTQLLENLSLPGDLGIEIISLRKRAGEIEEEQERLQLIQDLVQLLSRQGRAGETVDTHQENLPHFKETLLELFEWLSIPKEYSKQVDSLKSRITTIEDDPDLSVILRDTAIIINDLQSALQIELSDVQNFLTKVTTRLEEVECCFRDLASTETESRDETLQLNNDVRTNVRNIRDGITKGESLNEIKQTIENRLSFIEQSVEVFFQSTQKRQQAWEETVGTLNGRINSMKGETAKLHKRIQKEYKKAKTDALTGISNRLAYNEKIKQEFARWQRYAHPLSVCVIDVDRFKSVNDSYGHKAGDKVLKTIAEVCASKIRKMDFIARYGGEEFVLLLPETPLERAKVVAENLRQEIEICKFHYANKPVAITISCGLAELGEGDTTETVFERADKALYAAKESGRNCCRNQTQT